MIIRNSTKFNGKTARKGVRVNGKKNTRAVAYVYGKVGLLGLTGNSRLNYTFMQGFE